MQDSGIAILFKGINFQRLLGGLWVTLRIALVSIGLSCALGLLFGLLMLSRRKVAQVFCRIWLEIVRFMPQLVLLYIVYFGFARLFGWDLDGETSGILVFTFWGAAEMGDLIRGALTSIPLHQTESAAAIGLTRWQIYRHVLIPQMLRDYAGLGDEIVIIGVGTRAEIWNKQAWEDYLTAHEQGYADITSDVLPELEW